ncbi:FliM/FliN family flagellar motor C-terminal domain-containing protein [Chromobacterium vaccinii]|uniref:FliM/FliN family flagellar motor C-terminal domain-containing protein n=1 Tax=Chromobacterium vaccinii TaxID=1108595 RepID=UPI0006182B8A|nr:FliM/FliN family flagellar motor C-terminal domain-containing protein [Chromobacterium vaccinii]
MSRALPFRLYARKELDAVEAGIEKRYSAWLREWGLADGEAQVCVRPVSLADASAGKWLMAGGAWPAMSDQAGFFARVCLGVDKSRAAIEGSNLAASAIRAARDALAAAIAGADAPQKAYDDPRDGGQLNPVFSSTGALRAELRHADQTLVLLLSADQAKCWLSAPRQAAALEPILLRSLPVDGLVELEVRASPAQFSIEDLGSLRPGDVIRLDQKAGTPFDLRLQSGELLGRAQYGLHQGQPSVKVRRADKAINKSGKA